MSIRVLLVLFISSVFISCFSHREIPEKISRDVTVVTSSLKVKGEVTQLSLGYIDRSLKGISYFYSISKVCCDSVRRNIGVREISYLVRDGDIALTEIDNMMLKRLKK